MRGFPHVCALRSAQEFEELTKAAAADEHSLLLPTHGFKRDGQIIGGVSLGGSVLALCWFDRKSCHVRDTVQLINSLENTLRFRQVQSVVVPVASDSPLFPFMEKLGFEQRAPLTLFSKRL